ncbi:flagellar brake domain-containing protein [Psychromonas sp. psych-6C06]|uniref:flagellar brake domain-containing protein n=1 Tax=Psychromonas sp. psych-6C06 TaxID=2058089 RepID=UPI00187CAAAE|nr:flagellar brake domain-containing protein [Psychromonas sp. psych-6C06]
MADNNDNYSYLDKISCDTEVHLQIITATQPIRLKTRLIGVDPNMSVIVAMGTGSDWLSAKQYIREGQKVIVRLMSTKNPDANLIAFQSNIQKLMSIAGRWILLDYPQQVQLAPLRQDQRLPIHINAKLVNPETKKICSTGYLSDLSIHGCAFIGEPIQKASLSQHYILQVSIAGEVKSNIIMIKNRKKAGPKTRTMQYGGTLQGDEVQIKQFVEPLLIDCLFH